MSTTHRKPVLWLVILIPVMAVLMGCVTLYLAFSSSDGVVAVEEQPLSKTSWRESP